MPMQLQAVIWDLDGVILDSSNEHRLAWKRLAEEEGAVFTDEDFWATFGKRNNDIIPHYWHVSSAEHLQTLADRKEAYFRDFIRQGASFLPGAHELIHALHDAGFAQALASSAPGANIVLISELLGLGHYLRALVSGESVTNGKPAPDIFLRAAEGLNVPPAACVVIEDAVAGVTPVNKCNARSPLAPTSAS